MKEYANINLAVLTVFTFAYILNAGTNILIHPAVINV